MGIVIAGFALIRCLVDIATLVYEAVALQSIGSDGAAWFNMMLNKRFKGICRAVQCDVQTNAPHSFFQVSTLDEDRDNRFPLSTAASRA